MISWVMIPMFTWTSFNRPECRKGCFLIKSCQRDLTRLGHLYLLYFLWERVRWSQKRLQRTLKWVEWFQVSLEPLKTLVAWRWVEPILAPSGVQRRRISTLVPMSHCVTDKELTRIFCVTIFLDWDLVRFLNPIAIGSWAVGEPD